MVILVVFSSRSSSRIMPICTQRPGAGKSTISEEAVRSLSDYEPLRHYHVLHLDLDVCVPQWMRVRPNIRVLNTPKPKHHD